AEHSSLPKFVPFAEDESDDGASVEDLMSLMTIRASGSRSGNATGGDDWDDAPYEDLVL
ncbi:hypothetical protein SAMN04487859_1511, partial [Roseovarius lutimaris]